VPCDLDRGARGGFRAPARAMRGERLIPYARVRCLGAANYAACGVGPDAAVDEGIAVIVAGSVFEAGQDFGVVGIGGIEGEVAARRTAGP